MCHFETIHGVKVWLPDCMGGAVYGDKYHCTCERGKRPDAIRISYLEREVKTLALRLKVIEEGMKK